MKHACRIRGLGCVKNAIYSEAPLQFSNNHERTNSLDSSAKRKAAWYTLYAHACTLPQKGGNPCICG